MLIEIWKSETVGADQQNRKYNGKEWDIFLELHTQMMKV